MTTCRILGAALLGSLLFVATPASAQQQQQPPPQPQQQQPQQPPPGYQQQQVQGPQYTAPLYQTTQPSYVPQSVALSGPREIKDWNEGDPIPPGYRPVERTRTGLVVAGGVVFGTFYLFSLFAAAIGSDVSRVNGSNKNELAALYIPAVGPFVQLANTESSSGKFLCAIDGIAQTGGAIMLIVGLTSPRTILVRNDLAEVRVVPVVTKSSQGVGVLGTF